MGSLTFIQLLSLILLLIGIGLAFSQIRLSGWVLGWILLSGALLLQGFRSMLAYVAEHGGVDATTYTMANDWMGLGFSMLVVAAMHMMRQVFARHRLADESLRAFSAAANDVIIILDDTGTIVVWNQAAQRVFGYAGEEARGRRMVELIVPERARVEFESHLNPPAGNERSAAGNPIANLAGRNKNGMEIPTEYSVSATRIDGKRHTICIVRDISVRRQMENTLGRLKHLEGLLSICISCKKIRGEDNDWQQLERYISEHSDAVFSHGICPQCLDAEMRKPG